MRTPFTLICDEAHLYLPIKDEADAVQKQALYNFERIAKEGRKYGVSILAVSQRPADVSKTILSQCNNFVVLRLTNEKDKGVIKNLLPDSLKSTIEFLPLSSRHFLPLAVVILLSKCYLIIFSCTLL